MSRFRRSEFVERFPSYLFQETSIFAPPKPLALTPFHPSSFPIVEDEFDYALNLLDFSPQPPLLLHGFDTVTDLINLEETPFYTSTRRVVSRRVGLNELYLQALVDRVSDLEVGFDRLVREEKARKKKIGEYSWTAEIKSPEKERKYKWTAEIKDGKEEKDGVEKSYKWIAEVQGNGERTYTIKVSSGALEKKTEKKAVKKKKDGEKVKEKVKKVGPTARMVEIKEPSDHGAIVLKQVFAKRVEKRRGKRKELSPQEAAALIQRTFRAYLIRRSQALRALRELAIAKTKLKEIRAMFNNFSYRRQLSRDAVERQRFSEKIIVLLLTIDAIEGADMMVRAAKKSMVDELEAMLDVVDPEPSGKSLSMKRRTFDMPDGEINRELAAGVAKVVQMLDQDPTSSGTFEACL